MRAKPSTFIHDPGLRAAKGMARIYVVDNGGQWTHREWRVLKYLGVDTKIVANDTPVGDLQKENLDGLLLSGGAPRVGLADTLGNCGDYIDKLGVPTLGICAGHQFMARHFGGQASPGVGEFGAAELRLSPEGLKSPMFKDVPPTSTVWESHHDDVTEVPKDFIVLGASERCPVQAMQHKTQPFFGFQFHPEVEHSQHGGTMLRNFVEFCEGRRR